MKDIFMYLPRFFIDSHVHGRDMLEDYKATIYQTMKEALLVGIRVLAYMPNTKPAIVTIEILDRVLGLINDAQERLNVSEMQYVYFGVTDNNLDQCELALQREEVIGLKIYPQRENGDGVTTGIIGVVSMRTVLVAMKLAKKYDKVVSIHCSCPEKFFREKLDTIGGELSYLIKIVMVAKKVPGVKIVICHVSNILSAKYIIRAHEKFGINIAMELMPHYLWFDSEGTNWNPCIGREFYHCFNSLRNSLNREFLVSLLKTNYSFIFCASDTAVHIEEEKMAGFGGIPSNQELPAVVVTLAQMHGVSDERVADLLAFNQAYFLGIPMDRGLVKYRLIEKVDDCHYNGGKIINPWNGTRLYFPVRVN
ncbi:MAG: dihydroorotase family protein [Candidatus Aceula meridiana]|nr:dihydroorotase family protein [Candidatus Aceula meridiana]